jgi:hypothetical protein
MFVNFLALPPGRGIVSTLEPGAAHSASLHARHLANFRLPHPGQKSPP